MATPFSNLPLPTDAFDSSDAARKFFNSYYSQGVAIPAAVLDSTIGFFQNRGFSDTASQSVATVLLLQAKIDGINVFTLLDTLKGLNQLQLSTVVREVLNYNRLRISILGTRYDNFNDIQYELRNVLP